MRHRIAWIVALAALAAAEPAVAGKDLHFVILGDRTGSHQPGVYEGIVAEVQGLAPDFVVTVGDHIEGYTDDVPTYESQWDEYWKIVEPIRDRLHLCPGNHDILNPVGESEWRKRTGLDPSYSFDVDGIHFTILDTGRWNTSAEWIAAGGHRAWLEADLAAHKDARLTVVLYHKPFWFDTLAEGKPDPMHEIFKANGVDAVFNGHFHVYGTSTYDGIPYTIVGTSGGYVETSEEQGGFYQYAWCTVKDDRLSWSVLKRGSVLPPDVLRVSDLKLFTRVDGEYVRLASFPIAETPGSTGACRVTVRNAADRPMRTTLAWMEVGQWLMIPDRKEIEVPAGGSLEVPFDVAVGNAFYPLPKLTLDYPYREGKAFAYSKNLPAGRRQTVPRLEKPPKVDGVPDEAVWTAASRAEMFCAPEGGPSTIEPTAFWFGYDSKNLYVAARCTQADPSSYVIKTKERDGSVSRDDLVGVFLSWDPEERTFYQIYANPDGVIFDQKMLYVSPNDYGGAGTKWDGKYRIATARQADGWTFEAAIPFKTLETKAPSAGDVWRANFRRKEISKDSSADWQYPVTYEPSRFGYLEFR